MRKLCGKTTMPILELCSCRFVEEASASTCFTDSSTVPDLEHMQSYVAGRKIIQNNSGLI